MMARAPSRPCPIGISVVKLGSVSLSTGELNVSGVDIVDGSPLCDIKPYVPAFDSFSDSKAGWLDACRSPAPLSDGRFAGS